MKSKYLVLLIVVLLLIGMTLFFFVFYEHGDKKSIEYDKISIEQILGTWKVISKSGQALNYSLKYTFYENLTYLSEYNFTNEQFDYYGENYSDLNSYKIENNTVYLYWGSICFEMYAKFSDNGDTLTLYLTDMMNVFNVVMNRI